MILFNASTSLGLRNKTRFLTRTDTTTYTDADLDANLNNYLHIFTTEVLESMDGCDFKADTATTNIVADQQEYVLPTDLLKIKRIEVTYDGTNWKKVDFFDINERGTNTSTTSISSDFSTENPYVDLMDESLMLYPIPDTNVSAGLKIWYSKLDDTLESATDTPAIAEPFQVGLCYGAAKDYYERHSEKPNFADRALIMDRNIKSVIKKMKAFYNTHNQDRDYILDTVYVDYDDDYNK